MRKFVIFVVGIMAVSAALLSTSSATGEMTQERSDAKDQVILRFLQQPIMTAVGDYCGEHSQYWQQEVLNVQKIPESPYYEVVIQVETFHGAHNPPYGIETMTFHVGPHDEVQLVSYDHQDEAD